MSISTDSDNTSAVFLHAGEQKKQHPHRWYYWTVAVSFVLLQFFLQLSSGVVLGAIMHELKFNALAIGILASAFYYVYTVLQIPVGIIYDHCNARLIITSSVALCSLGCFMFAATHSFPLLFIGRLLIGAGSAFAFVGLTHILRQYFPLRDFSFLIGLSETLGFFATVIGMIGMGSAIAIIGWREFIVGAGIFGLIISMFSLRIFPANELQNNHSFAAFLPAMKSILKNPYIWLNSIFVSLSFTVITVFGALWVIPFLQVKLNCSLTMASYLGAMVFAGAGISCPLFGKLAIVYTSRRRIMLASCLTTAILEALFLYGQHQNLFLNGLLLFLTGLCCGGYLLSFSIANELATKETLSTCTGFTNTLTMLSAPILQPLIGHILDQHYSGSTIHTLWDYQLALSILPACLIISALMACFLPEKNHTSTHF